MRRAVLTIGIALSCGLAGAAWGSIAEIDRLCQKSGCTDHSRYTADPGERNDIRVTADDSRTTTYTDSGAAVRGGPGCRVLDAHTVTCRRTEYGETYGPSIDAGDGDDRIEDVNGDGSYLDGGPGDDVIIGNSGFQYLRAGGGKDRMEGRGGFNEFEDEDVAPWNKYDRPDSDTLVGSADGRDAVRYSARRRPVTVDLAAGVAGEPGERDRLISIEEIFAGSGDDVLAGDDGPNRFFNSAGDDRISGRGGDDEINTGPGGERVNAGAGDDLVELGWHLEMPGDDPPDRVTCGPGTDRVTWAEARDLVGVDCESVAMMEATEGGTEVAAVTLRLPLKAPRDSFVVLPRHECFSPTSATIVTVRVSDGRAPAKGLLGRSAAGCSKRSNRVRELRLALSPAGAAYLRRVKSTRARIAFEFRSGSSTTRGGFTTTLRHPAA